MSSRFLIAETQIPPLPPPYIVLFIEPSPRWYQIVILSNISTDFHNLVLVDSVFSIWFFVNGGGIDSGIAYCRSKDEQLCLSKWLDALRGSSPAHKSWLQPKMAKAKADCKISQPLEAPKFTFLTVFSSWVVLNGLKLCCMSRAFHCDALDTSHTYIHPKIKFDLKWGDKTEGIGAK